MASTILAIATIVGTIGISGIQAGIWIAKKGYDLAYWGIYGTPESAEEKLIKEVEKLREEMRLLRNDKLETSSIDTDSGPICKAKERRIKQIEEMMQKTN